jgi:ligand-binding SRPBCC domain-containing protein
MQHLDPSTIARSRRRPNYFVDEMVQGAFNRFRHEHHFKQMDEGTVMTDVVDYSSPLGVLGRLADVLFLKIICCAYWKKGTK